MQTPNKFYSKPVCVYHQEICQSAVKFCENQRMLMVQFQIVAIYISKKRDNRM